MYMDYIICIIVEWNNNFLLSYNYCFAGEPVFPFGAAPIQTSATLRGDPVKLTLPLFYIIRGVCWNVIRGGWDEEEIPPPE